MLGCSSSSSQSKKDNVIEETDLLIVLSGYAI